MKHPVIRWVAVGLLLALLGGVSFYYWRSNRALAALAAATNSELTQAKLEIGKARSKLVKQEELNKAARALIHKKWQDEVDAHKATVVALGELRGRLKSGGQGKVRWKVKWRDRTIVKTADKLAEGLWACREDGCIMLSEPDFEFRLSDWRLDLRGNLLAQRFHYTLEQLFRGRLLVTRLPTGGKNYYLDMIEVDPRDKTVAKIELEKFEVLHIDELAGKMMWWNPKLDVQLGAGIGTDVSFAWGGDVGVSFSAWGKTPDDLTWRFFRPSVGLGSGAGLTLGFAPAQLNLGKFLPLISNMWLTPQVAWNFGTGAAQITLGIGATL